VGEMDIEEFLRALAQARYIQELEKNVVARAVSEVFSE
jgi:acyl-ACP thioesterase